MAIYNVQQITNFDIANKPSVQHNITVPSFNKDGGVIDIIQKVEYKTILSNTNIIKLGYCCEPKGIILPIFLERDGEYKEFQIGRDGMYEFQNEEILSDDNEITATDVLITGIQVPTEVNFTLEYVVEI